jgi:hypothetical protein
MQPGWRSIILAGTNPLSGATDYTWTIVWQFGEGNTDYIEDGGADAETPLPSRAEAEAEAQAVLERLTREQPHGPRSG